MGKMSELAQTIEDLRKCALQLSNIADSLTEMFSGKAETVSEVKDKQAEQSLTLETVRAVLAEKSRDGHTAEIRELLQKYGATKLSEIARENYETLLKDAEELDNAT